MKKKKKENKYMFLVGNMILHEHDSKKAEAESLIWLKKTGIFPQTRFQRFLDHLGLPF